MLIGVVISGLVEEYNIHLCRGVEKCAKKDDVNVVIIPGKFVGFDYATQMHNQYGYCFNSVFSFADLECFDGLIIEMSSIGMFASDEKKEAFVNLFRKIPHVFINYEKEGYSNIQLDNKSGLVDALSYLYKNGARKYAMIGGPDGNADALARKQVFFDFLEKNQLYRGEEVYEAGDFFQDCSAAIHKLIKANENVDAFICGNDIIASRLYKILDEYDIKPGIDVSVLGFDDSVFTTSIYPNLSSVRTDVVKLGMEAYGSLMELLKNGKIVSQSVPSSFILRESIISNKSNESTDLTQYSIKDILHSNVVYDDDSTMDQVRETFKEFVQFVHDINDCSDEMISIRIDQIVKRMIAQKTVDMIDVNRVICITEKLCKDMYQNTDSDEIKHKSTILFIEILKSLTQLVHLEQSRLDYMDFNMWHHSEAFVRDAMAFTRTHEKNYANMLKHLGFLGVQHAYFYLYEKPVIYKEGQYFKIPNNLYLKAYTHGEDAKTVSKAKQEIPKEQVFTNNFIQWKNQNYLIVLPLYSEKYIYGVLLCDMQSSQFPQAEYMINQINSAVRIFRLQTEYQQMMTDYEESLRKLKENNIALDTMSKSDPLTGLNNRRGFDVRIEKLTKHYPSKEQSLLFGIVDMNDLKMVNDQFGHDDGDFSLKTIGTILNDFTTEYDGFAARIGGDEFAFAFPVDNDKEQEAIESELYAMFEEFNRLSTKQYNVSVCVGTYKKSMGDTIPVEDAYNLADEKLYYAKMFKKGELLK